MCHHFQGVGGWFEAGDRVVMMVLDVVGVVDGSGDMFDSIVNNDVAVLR